MATDIGESVTRFILEFIGGMQDLHDAAPVLLALAQDDLKYLHVCQASPRECNLVNYNRLVDAYRQDYCPRLPHLHRFLHEKDQLDYLYVRVQIDQLLDEVCVPRRF